MYLFNPSIQAGCDTKSIVKRSVTGLNSKFSFFKIKAKEFSRHCYLPTMGTGWKYLDSYFSQGYKRYIKCKQLLSQFELGSQSTFSFFDCFPNKRSVVIIYPSISSERFTFISVCSMQTIIFFDKKCLVTCWLVGCQIKFIHIHIKDIWFLNELFGDNILSKPEFICLHSVKLFKVFL